MAKKQSRVSVNKLENYYRQTTPIIIDKSFDTSSGEVVEYQIKNRLSLEECIRFVNDVVSQYVRPDEATIIPITREFILHRNILTYYGNFNMPADVSKAFDIVMGASDIIDDILDYIDMEQYNMIIDAIDESIAFETQKMIALQEMKVNEAVAQLNQVVTQMSSLFEGIDNEQMAGFIEGISKMPNVTAEDLAEAFVNKVSE